MPNRNGTGPEGKGSRTGRGMGRCRKNTGNEETPARGTGKNRRNGGGQGKGNRSQRGS
ncbi:MAG TPA: DUF5320 domain-containing protein [Bacteroidales bacterium]|nr:DUF5320 domain-containing protein [Bacteroidales bacterium]